MSNQPIDALVDPEYRKQVQGLKDVTATLKGEPSSPVIFSTDAESALNKKMQNQQGVPREVHLSEATQEDSVLSAFAGEVAADSDVHIYSAKGPLRLKPGATPPVRPERHVLADGREAWVSRFPVMPESRRPFVLIVVEGYSAEEKPEPIERHRG